MKKKLTKEQIRELICLDYEEFVSDFEEFIIDDISLTNFLLYTILKEIAK